MSSRDFKVRFYQPGDEVGIVNLLQNTFPKWAMTNNPVNFWKWKYTDAPYGTKILVAVIDDIIIGVDHSIFLPLKINDKNLTATFSGDTATHLDYRGIGVYSRIIKLLDQNRKSLDMEFSYYLSSNNRIIKNAKDRGRFNLFPNKMTYMVKIKDLNLHMNMRKTNYAVLKKIGLKTIEKMSEINKRVSRNGNHQNHYTISKIKKFGTNITEFNKSTNENYDFIIKKEQKYLNWRYTDQRAGKFTILQATENNRVVGYIVIEHKNEDGYKEDYIIDLIAIHNNLDITETLLREACSRSIEDGCNVIYYLVVNRHPNQKIAERNGFINSYKSPNIIYYYLEKNITKRLTMFNPIRCYMSYNELII
jgi:hypothetical protein